MYFAPERTTVEIDPSELCAFSETSAVFRVLEKRIDKAIGLQLTLDELRCLNRGSYADEKSVPSINQTSSFVNMTPMFINIEVQRPYSDIDPKIQLGAWIAAEYEKRNWEGYSLNQPVLAVTAVGDEWQVYLDYAEIEGDRFGCKFVGPWEMGNTRSIEGAFKILSVLSDLCEWGITEYRGYFEKEILALYKPG